MENIIQPGQTQPPVMSQQQMVQPGQQMIPPGQQQPFVQQPMYANGGVPSQNSVTSFFNGVTIGDVVVTGLAILGILVVIDYHRKLIKHNRIAQKKTEEMQEQLTEVRDNVQKAMGDTYEFY